jgi:hypothetical protein
MRKQRRADVARGLRFWATCSEQDARSIDERVRRFVAERGAEVEALKRAEDDLKELELRRLKLTSSLLNSWYSMTEEAPRDVKTAGVCVDDLVFWNRLMHVSPETYEFLQPRWERFERLLVSAKLREHGMKERSGRVARLLCDDVSSKRSQESRRGEDHEEKDEEAAGG